MFLSFRPHLCHVHGLDERGDEVLALEADHDEEVAPHVVEGGADQIPFLGFYTRKI